MKTHILNADGKKTLCGRTVDDFTPVSVNKQKPATCKVCLQKQAMAAVTDHDDPMMSGFTEQQIAFAAHPLVMVNARRAARECGLAEAAASSMKKRMYPLIVHFQRERAERFAISKEAIQHQLAAIGFANMIDYVNIDEKTGAVTAKRLDELTRDQAAAIQEYKTSEVEEIDPETGEKTVTHVLSHIRLFDKRSALVDLGKTIGLFTNSATLQLPGLEGSPEAKADVPLSKLSTNALERIYDIMRTAAQTVESAQQDTKAIPGQCTVVKNGK